MIKKKLKIFKFVHKNVINIKYILLFLNLEIKPIIYFIILFFLEILLNKF
jgi:hypothetical protein